VVLWNVFVYKQSWAQCSQTEAENSNSTAIRD